MRWAAKMESGDDLSSRAVSSQVLSTLKGLTSVFGMGTGGTPSPLSPEIGWRLLCFSCFALCTSCLLGFLCRALRFAHPQNLIPLRFCVHRVSPGASKLSLLLRRIRFFLDQALDRLVLTSFRITAFTPSTYQPCRLQGVLPAYAVGYFFSRGASRLDAFSVYPVRTSLPCYAVGTTTVAPEVRPFRSSRTRNSSSHVSCAHDG